MKKTKKFQEPQYGKRGRTIILKKKGNPDAAKWVRWLEDHCQASAGPHGNLTGMRNLYWGKESLVVKAGAYLYYLKRFDDFKPLPWER